MILVSGASGRIGSATLAALTGAGHAAKGLVRTAAKHEHHVVGAFDDRPSLDAALAGVERALLVCANSRGQQTLESAFVDACIDNGVREIIKISAMEAGPDASSPIPQAHYAVEQRIRASSLKWTFLQPNFFMQNLLMFAGGIKATGQFALPFGDARVAPVDCADVGAVAANLLVQGVPHGRSLQLSGPELLTFTEIARELSAACDREIRYLDIAPADFANFMAGVVPDPWHADAVCRLFAEIKAGALAHTDNTLSQQLGRPPTRLADFASNFRAAFTR